MDQEQINEARKRIYGIIQEFYTSRKLEQRLIATEQNADILLTILYQRNKEEINNLDKEEKDLLDYFEEKRKNDPLLDERIKQIKSSYKWQKLYHSNSEDHKFEPKQKLSPMALRFGTIEQQNQNNPFSFEIFEARREIIPLQCPCKDCIEIREFAENSAKRNIEIKEEKDEVYEHIRNVEKQIYNIFKEYERMNNNFSAQWYYPIKMNILNGKFKGMLANFQEFFNHKKNYLINKKNYNLPQKRKKKIRSHHTFSSEDIKEIYKPWGS
ncbi:17795_t:CDS:2 [Gigaspora rosea]|nr:17795_t:CDS:2 [Gigaspora rosea]